jgi:glycosyltransferase involved in cell wall biosynthesis
LLKLRKKIKDYQPNYIHVYNLASLLYLTLYLFGRIYNYKVILHVHDFYSKDRLLRPISKLLKKKPSYIIPVSNSVKLDLIKLGFDETRIHCIHNGIDTDLLPKTDCNKENNGLTIGFVGSLSRWKGLHILLGAAKKLEDQGYYFNYVIVGAFDEAEYKRQILNQCAQINHSKINFLGRRTDARELMKSFDLLVHCSIEPDPFPTVLLEGMHLGCPVIGPKCGGVPEIIDDHKNGLLFETNSKESLAKAILKMTNDRNLRRQLAANALTKANKELSLNRFRSEFFNYTGINH